MRQTTLHRLLTVVLAWAALLVSAPALAQTGEVSGTVSDAQGEPLIGATVMVKGTATGAKTDYEGHYRLAQVPAKAQLSVSYVGFLTKDVAVEGRRVIDITLAEDAAALDEVVVIGYGTLKKSDMTGAISSVDVSELAKRTTSNPAEALQGKISGVNVLKAGGNAGAGVQIKIRGVKTFGDNEPLYIIDGFPGDINAVNPQDIEAMEVLKDGAAAAIYGSVAANGVVIITTKNGRKGEVKVDFTSYLSMHRISGKLEMLNADEYKRMHTQMYENWNAHTAIHGGAPVDLLPYMTKNTGVDTDWTDTMTRTGLSQNYMLSLRGGSDMAQYSVSYNHVDDRGIFLGNDFRQDNARLKLHAKKGIFDVDANMAFKYTDSKQPQYSIKEMYMLSPLVPVYNENEEYGYGLTNFDNLPNNRNIMADHHYQTETDRKYHTTANIAVTANFTPWLSFKTSYAYRGEHEREAYHAPAYVSDVKAKREYPYNSESTYYWQEYVWENVLSFNRKFGRHSLNAVVGTSTTGRTYNWNSVAVEGKTTLYKVEDGQLVVNETPAGFLDSAFKTIDAGAGGTYEGSGSNWEYKRVGFFGRANYNYADRYLLQVTVRHDGSSKFGADKRWGTFPSVALGWRISEESFFPKDSFIDNLKLRASWGRLGNENALGYYDFQALISTYNTKYQGYVKGNGDNAWAGSIARALENRSLKWETTDTKNVGIDFAMLRNRLTGSLNYYYNKTEDLLITKALPPSAGLEDPTLNVGKIRNCGFELEANWSDKAGDLTYSVGLNLTTTKNKVLELANAGQVLYGEGLKYGTEHFPTQTREGMPIGAFYLYKTEGIFQSDAEAANYKNAAGERLQPLADAGDLRFADVNGDGQIDDDDKVYCGSGIPSLEANVNLSAEWRGFDLSAVIGSA